MWWGTSAQSHAKRCGGVARLGKVGCTQRESWVYAQGGREAVGGSEPSRVLAAPVKLWNPSLFQSRNVKSRLVTLW
jgi:hypothetical protein